MALMFGAGDLEWVIIRTIRYPLFETAEPANTAKLKSHFDKMGFLGHFASVAIASAEDLFDPDAEINRNSFFFTGGATYINFEGFRSLSIN